MCLGTAGDAKGKARLRSVERIGSGSWLEAVPFSEKLAFNPSEFRLAALLRMGCPMLFGGWLSHCECGKVLDKDGYHLSYKHGGGPIWQHDSVVNGWSECLREVGLHHRKEPRDRYTNNDTKD